MDAIRTVHRGESALHPTVARKLVREIKRPTTVPAGVDPLSPRELDVLRCLALGWTIREIAFWVR